MTPGTEHDIVSILFIVLVSYREATVNLTVNDVQYTFQAKMQFTIAIHNNDFIFETLSEAESLYFSSKFMYLITFTNIIDNEGCGSNMYGGFNYTSCQSCPTNSVNVGGYSAASCKCIVSPCVGKYCIVTTAYLFMLLVLCLLMHCELSTT